MTNIKNYVTKSLLLGSITPMILFADFPSAPSDLTLTATSGSTVSLRWKDNSNNETGFKIFRNGVLVATTGANAQGYTDTGLSKTTKYDYLVKATNNDSPANSTGIVLNELMASNGSTNLDPDFYKASDWIELHNYKNYSVNIGGFYLSNKKGKSTLWKIPSGTTIPAHGHLLIWADKKNTGLHTNFKLSSKKEAVTLANRSGQVIDTLKYAKLKVDVAATRTGYVSPTPGRANSTDFALQVAATKPIFSLQGGVFTSTQTVRLSSSENEGVIYYTTDGSIPTKNSQRYTQPIRVTHSTSIRARVLGSTKLFGKVATKTYLINPDTALPIVSLTTDNDNLFDNTIGIHTVGTNGVPLKQCMSSETVPYNYANDWKRPAHIEYFDDNHQAKFSLDLDIAISGQCSRHNNKKSFKLKVDKKYGVKSLDYVLYPDKDLKKITNFKLRTGNRQFEIGDILANILAERGLMNVDFQAYRTVEMFMNGEYWGVYNLRENKGKSYIGVNYPEVNTKKLDMIIEGWVIKEGDRVEFEKLSDYIDDHDFANNAAYNEVSTMVDIDSFMDYMIIMIFSANDDWVESNERCWREKKADAKWRWMLDDVDEGFQKRGIYDNTFVRATQDGPIMTNLLRKLLKNQTFKNQFKNRFNNKLNTIFAPSYIHALADDLLDERSENITKGRWGISRSKYNRYVGELREFINKRRNVVRSQLNNL